MHVPPIQTVLLDFDGVVLESVDIKTDVFRFLFRKSKHAKAIVQHHLKNTGVSRFDKFDYIYKRILRRPLSGAKRRQLGDAFSKQVFHRVMRCPFVKGAEAFLKRHYRRIPLFVLSATPAPELRNIIRRRGLSRYFKAVFGHPVSKKEAIRRILKRGHFTRKNVLMVGDALADWEAARSQRVRFIARVTRGQRFRFPKSVKQVRDLRQLDGLLVKFR